MTRWRLQIFSATYLAYVGLYFCRKPFSVVKSTLGGELGLDASHLGAIGAAYLFAYALGQFAAGALGGWLGPKKLFLLGMALSIVAAIGFGLGESFALFTGMMVVIGLGQAVGWPAGVGIMAAWFPPAERGRVMGLWATNFQAGSLLATLMASAILVRWGWRASFFGGAAVLTVVWIVNALTLADRPEDVGFSAPHDEPDDESFAASSPWTFDLIVDVALIGIFYFFIKLIRYALWSWVPFFLKHNYGLDSDAAGYLSTIFDIAGIPGVLVTGWLSDKVFGSQRAMPSLIMMVVLFLGCGMLMTFGRDNLHVFAACLGLVGFSLFGPDALMTSAGAADLADRRLALQVTGLIAAMGSCGPIVQELVIGRLYDSNGGDLHGIFSLLVVSAGASTLALALRAVRERRTPVSHG